MAEIRVTSGELKKKAGELRNLNTQFQREVEEMTSEEQRLVNMWDGEAKEAFHTAYSSDKAQMDTFYQEIEKYCVKLEEIANIYERAESQTMNTAGTRTYK